MQPENTYLSLERFRQILGLSVLDFYGVTMTNCGHTANYGCADVWTRDGNQAENNTLSWSHLLNAISAAEVEIATFLSQPLGRDWVCEQRAWPHTWNGMQALQATYDLGGHFIEGGQKAETLIDTANKSVELIFSDTDGDGFPELATITLAGFTGLDVCDIEFRYGTEIITNTKSISINGDTLTATFLSLALLDPSQFDGLFINYPIEICCDPADGGCDQLDVFVDTVDVYRIYNDTTAVMANVCSLADSQNGCQPCSTDPCEPECQEACMIPVADSGLVRIVPADRDGAGGWTWLTNCGLSCPPNYVELNYMVNPCVSSGCATGDCYGLCKEYEVAIVALAAARLIKTCTCKCADNRIKWYQRQMGTENNQDNFAANQTTFSMIEQSPFGVLYGELYAYQLLQGTIQKKVGMVSLG